MKDHDTEREKPGEPEYSSGYVWYVIVLLSVVYSINYMDRMALAVLAPLIKRDLALSDTQLGLMVGLAFSLFFAVCGIPIARWADRGVRRNIVATALVTWSAMTALSGAAQNVWQLFLTRVGVGVGEAGCVPPSHAMLCDYVPVKRRAGVFAINHFGVYGGMMLGMGLAGVLAGEMGWRSTFWVLGLPGFILALVVRFTLCEPVRGRFDAVAADSAPASFGETMQTLWRSRTYRLLMLFCVTNGFVQYGLNQWWPSLYERVYGLQLSSLGLSLGAAIGVGSALGLLAGGVLANKVADRDIRLPLTFGAGATALALPAGLGSLYVDSPLDSILLISLTTFFWSVSNGTVSATLYSVTKPSMRATAGAIAIFGVSAIGYSAGPFCVGRASDFLAPSLGVQSLRYALLLPLCLLPVMVALLVAVAKGYPNELAAIRSLSLDVREKNVG